MTTRTTDWRLGSAAIKRSQFRGLPDRPRTSSSDQTRASPRSQEQSWSPVALPLPPAVFTRFPAFARYRAAFSEGSAPGLGGLGKGAALPSYLVIDLVADANTKPRIFDPCANMVIIISLICATLAAAAPPAGWETCGGLPASYNATACPSSTATCCHQHWAPGKGNWGCCPGANAVCCSNGYTCCPSGTKCKDKGGGWGVVTTCELMFQATIVPSTLSSFAVMVCPPP